MGSLGEQRQGVYWAFAVLGLACSHQPYPGHGSGSTGGITGATGGWVAGDGVGPVGGRGGTISSGGITSAASGSATGGGAGRAPGDAGGPTTSGCGSRDVPIDSTGWVDLASTGCEIQGAWWWAKDDEGTTIEDSSPTVAPYVAGRGMCLKGRTVPGPTGAAQGATIGLDLNANLPAGWNAVAHGVVGFDVEISGSAGGTELRLELESLGNRAATTVPFIGATTARRIALIDRAIVPVSTGASNQGEKAAATDLRRLQLHVVGGRESAVFDVCIARLRPIVGNCADDVILDAGGDNLRNTVWNTTANHSQCVFVSGRGADTRFGWLWRWPDPTSTSAVGGFPELVVGKDPWRTASTNLGTSHNIPAPILAVFPSHLDLDLEVGAGDTYGFAPEIWLTSESAPTSSNVTDEIAIWFAHNNMTPAGSKVDMITLSDVDYDVWLDPHHSSSVRSSTMTWQYVAFVSRTPVYPSTLPVGYFLGYLLQKNYVPSARWIASIELGTAIVGGSGSAIFNTFYIQAGP
jgi:hypothetical protein